MWSESWKARPLLCYVSSVSGREENAFQLSCVERRRPEGAQRHSGRPLTQKIWRTHSIAAFRPERHTRVSNGPTRKHCLSKLYFISTISTWLFFHSPALRFIKGHHIKLWITGDEIFYFQFRRQSFAGAAAARAERYVSSRLDRKPWEISNSITKGAHQMFSGEGMIRNCLHKLL